MAVRAADVRTPPSYCQYSDGPCDQDFSLAQASDGLFLYPSQPEAIASTVQAAVTRLKQVESLKSWKSWRELPVHGQIIFCEVSKAIRFTNTVIADVTTLNFNLLFEVGFAIGLGIPVIPIRDTSYIKSKKDFAALGILDTIGYVDFANADELVAALVPRLPGTAFPPTPAKTYIESPLYILKGPVATEGVVRLMSTLKKSGFSFRTHDPLETPRLSLHDARRQIAGSIGVIANLLSPHRAGSTPHNGLCSLLGGIAMAQQKVVAMLQEESVEQPIDYRDVVQTYVRPDDIPGLLERPIRQVVENMQQAAPSQVRVPKRLLERIDLGDIAAENEIAGLRSYFVQTGQFRLARQGHARLVVGRKGTGKTAMFYALRHHAGRSYGTLVLDLKPEGHQFLKLREAMLHELPPGIQEHTMTAFWNYILLAELAHKVLQREVHHAERDPGRLGRFNHLQNVYFDHSLASGDVDLSQRLLRQVDRVIARYGELGAAATRDRLTEIVYSGDIRDLEEAVSDYLQEKEAIWILIDNLDKGWSTRGTSEEEILIVRSLLEASRKLQNQFEERDIALRCVVFLRADIYEHLVRDTPDKGKDTPITLDWDDPAVFKEVIRRRVEASGELSGSFGQVWLAIAESHVGTEDSFNYILDRTLMRPRDLLTFIQRSIQVALNRGKTKVEAEDIKKAEQGYSEDTLLTTAFEIADTRPALEDILFAFEGCSAQLSRRELVDRLLKWGVDVSEMDAVIELLVWFGFVGVGGRGERATYSYEVRYNVRHSCTA